MYAENVDKLNQMSANIDNFRSKQKLKTTKNWAKVHTQHDQIRFYIKLLIVDKFVKIVHNISRIIALHPIHTQGVAKFSKTLIINTSLFPFLSECLSVGLHIDSMKIFHFPCH